jgi:hypothetical protein
MLERNSSSFKVDHLYRASITHWSNEGEPRLSGNRDGEMGSNFLETHLNLGFRQSGTTIFKDKEKQKGEEIPEELKKEMLSEA